MSEPGELELPREEDAPREEADPSAEEWRDKYLRTLAELDNFRKRSERERESARRYALEGFLRDLLPLLDGLEAAAEAEGGLDAIRKGIRLVHQSALNILKDKGLEVIDAMGQPFDPRIHEAVGMSMDPKKAPGTIVKEDRPGYRLHDRVLRPSWVHIAVVPTPAADGGEDPEDS